VDAEGVVDKTASGTHGRSGAPTRACILDQESVDAHPGIGTRRGPMRVRRGEQRVQVVVGIVWFWNINRREP
jgi:hypothetical protein